MLKKKNRTPRTEAQTMEYDTTQRRHPSRSTCLSHVWGSKDLIQPPPIRRLPGFCGERGATCIPLDRPQASLTISYLPLLVQSFQSTRQETCWTREPQAETTEDMAGPRENLEHLPRGTPALGTAWHSHGLCSELPGQLAPVLPHPQLQLKLPSDIL